MLKKFRFWEIFTGQSEAAIPVTEKYKAVQICDDSNSEKSEQTEEEKARDGVVAERGGWAGQVDFLMSLIAYAVGLGNVWRFPYLCFKNGGGAFLIPYLICWSCAAVPMFFMEVSFGQLVQQGGIGIWKICPIFKGVGIANVILSCFCNIYYCVIVSWALFYLIASFQTTFPWEDCGHWWNDASCISPYLNMTTIHELNRNMSSYNVSSQTPVEQFWENRVLMTTKGIHESGTIQWELMGLLAGAWVVVYIALRKGITESRKFIYFCALSPYVLLIILFVRGITLEGAGDGLRYLFYPDVSKLMSPTVWKDAGTQVFYSYGIGFGTLVALGSYNKYHHNTYRDSLILCVINLCTSLLAGFVVFSVLGYMAFTTEKTVPDVVKSGVGLAFNVYPEVVIKLPLKQLWSVLFFVMIAILGMDSQVCTVEGVVTAMCDEFPKTLRKHKSKFVAGLCIVNFLLALPMVSQSGQYWLTLVDGYAASGIPMLFIVFFEIIGLSWGFGAGRLYNALEDMLGFRPSFIWGIFWQITSPAICLVLFVFVVLKYEPLMYASGEAYPVWAQVLGLLMALTSMLAVPLFAIRYLWRSPVKGLREKFRLGLKSKIAFGFEMKRPNGLITSSIDPVEKVSLNEEEMYT